MCQRVLPDCGPLAARRADFFGPQSKTRTQNNNNITVNVYSEYRAEIAWTATRSEGLVLLELCGCICRFKRFSGFLMCGESISDFVLSPTVRQHSLTPLGVSRSLWLHSAGRQNTRCTHAAGSFSSLIVHAFCRPIFLVERPQERLYICGVCYLCCRLFALLLLFGLLGGPFSPVSEISFFGHDDRYKGQGQGQGGHRWR